MARRMWHFIIRGGSASSAPAGSEAGHGRAVALILCVLVVSLSVGVVGYVQKTLRTVRAGLPVAVMEQQREIVGLGAALERLLLDLRTARLGGATADDVAHLLDHVRGAEEWLARMRRSHTFDDLVGASAVHAVANPVLVDVRNWLEEGIHALPASSPLVLRLCDRRVNDAIVDITPLLGAAQDQAVRLLKDQGTLLDRFQDGLIAILVLVAALAVLSILLVIRALADRRRVATALEAARDAAERASVAKSQFLAGMSHELRTPLNAIIGFSAMIRDQAHGPAGDPSYVEYGSDIHDSGVHLLSIVNDVLDLAKVEAGRYELEHGAVDLRAIVRATLRTLSPRAREGEVTLSADLSEGLPPVNGDERALRQVLLNLVSNAVKFTLPGGRVLIRAYRTRGGFVTVEVVDTGIGIPDDRIDAVLRPFEQIDNGLQRRYEGTGLGLPLARSLVELHGGQLRIASRAGVGTTVSADLPVHAGGAAR